MKCAKCDNMLVVTVECEHFDKYDETKKDVIKQLIEDHLQTGESIIHSDEFAVCVWCPACSCDHAEQLESIEHALGRILNILDQPVLEGGIKGGKFTATCPDCGKEYPENHTPGCSSKGPGA